MTEEMPPDILYHYTTQEGLLGILKAKQEPLDQRAGVVLWATKIQYMNDASELVTPLRMADEILQQKESECDVGDTARASTIHQMRWAIENSQNVNISVT